NLNIGTSWVGGTPPTSADVAVWDSTVTIARTNLLGSDTNWGGIVISPAGANPGGPVTIAGSVSGAALTVVANNATLTYATAPANPLANGNRAVLNGTTAPTGFSFGTLYYVVNATATTFQLSATSGGAAITPTITGSLVNVTGGPALTLGASGIDMSAS